MNFRTLSAVLIAVGLVAAAPPARAYEGPQERALDKSLQDYGTQDTNQDGTAQLNRPTPAPVQSGQTAAAGTVFDDPSAVHSRPTQVEPSVEGPEEKALDSSLMNYRIQQDSANGSPQ